MNRHKVCTMHQVPVQPELNVVPQSPSPLTLSRSFSSSSEAMRASHTLSTHLRMVFPIGRSTSIPHYTGRFVYEYVELSSPRSVDGSFFVFSPSVADT